MADFVNRYSRVEKALHHFAFKSWFSQIALSKIENRVFSKQLADVEVKIPLFITALPRAGTTLLLELCVATEEFVSHTYRDMPFILIPMLWDRFVRVFRQLDTPMMRAHGDGMMVSVDSPEAFEEIIWKTFWASHYKADRIVPWKGEDYPGFENFIYNHLCKIISLRGSKHLSHVRYVSKNNTSIARLGYLSRVFPDAIIIVPFREPLQHASSLFLQHCNFLELQKEDSFTRKYMEAIGHYDFGVNLRPIDFDGWLSSGDSYAPNTLRFWVQYWISTYRYLLKNTPKQVKFLSYDAFCDNPTRGLEQLAKFIKIRKPETLVAKADRIVVSKPYSEDTHNIEPELLKQAKILYTNLQEVSLL